ncbi:MAG: hypothetical protein AcusKO_31480 [Acuticoccus sp.]
MRQTSLAERIASLEAELTAYQDARYAARFCSAIDALAAADAKSGVPGMRLTRLAAEALFKAMAYKDEYEVARLYSDDAYRADLNAAFSDPGSVRLMLAPPLLSRTDPATGRPQKRAFGPWVFPLLRVLARCKGLRGTRFDPFGRTAERRSERALVDTVLADIARAGRQLPEAPYDLLCDLVEIGSRIKGYGVVKAAHHDKAMRRRQALLARLEGEPQRAGWQGGARQRTEEGMASLPRATVTAGP